MVLIAAELITVFRPVHRVFAEPRDLPRDQQPREFEAGVTQTDILLGDLDYHVRRDAPRIALLGRGAQLWFRLWFRPCFGLRLRRTRSSLVLAAAADIVIVDADSAVRPLKRTTVGRVISRGGQRQSGSPPQ